jgi:hypothetical protein
VGKQTFLKSANPQILDFIPLRKAKIFYVLPVCKSHLRRVLRQRLKFFTAVADSGKNFERVGDSVHIPSINEIELSSN